MIDFSHIDRFSWKYDLYNRYLRLNHNYFYYKEYRIVNKENIPPKGEPTFIYANHQNGLTDALIILYMFDDKRQPVFIARGDIFKKDTVAKLLRFLKILPTFRDRDGNRDDVRSNSNTFHIAADVLKRGGTLAMFPEAAHQHGNYLGSFKKGFPRVAFYAEEKFDSRGIKVLPVNIYYDNYYNFRSKVVLTVGEPFFIDDLMPVYEKEPNQAYLELNERARERLKAITLDEGPDFFEEYDIIRKMLHKERLISKGKDPGDIYARKLEDMEIVAELDHIRQEDQARFEGLMNMAREYDQGVRKLGIRDWLVNRKIKMSGLLGRALLLLLTFPFFLFGWINNILPFSFPQLLKNRIKDKQLHSSMNFAPSLVITFPLMYLTLFILSWVLSGKLWFALLYVLAAFGSLFIFYHYKIAFLKFKGAWRYYRLQKKQNPLLRQLEEIKRKIQRYGDK